MRRLLGSAMGLLGALTVMFPAVAGSAGAASALPGGVLRPADPHRVLPTANATVSSLNWSGYATVAAAHTITAASTHYIVPTVKSIPVGFSSTWVGIGGYNTSDLIQAGTESDTAQTPYAWYEILPASETPITSGCSGDNTCTVKAGDAMSVTIRNTGGNGWTISMTNPRWTWSQSLK